MVSSWAMEQNDEDKKKLNDDVVVFMRKRSETEAPRYTARLKTYVDIQQKHRRAAIARLHSEHGYKKNTSASRKKTDGDQKQQAENTEHPGNDEERMSRRGRLKDKAMHRLRSFSRSASGGEPSDRCGRRRRRRSCRRRRRYRRRSCRRRRRRRSCFCKRRRRRSRRRRRRRRRSRRRRRVRRYCY